MKTLFTTKHFRKYYLPLENEKQGRINPKLFTGFLLFLVLGISNTYAQAPKISYATPQVFAVGQAVSVPVVNKGGAMLAPVITTLPGTYQDARQIAIDASGNLYVADVANNLVEELPAGATAPITIGSGFSAPTGVAVDAAGNVYVADDGHNEIKKIPAGNGAVVTIATGLGGPYNIALDGKGYLYITEATTNDIKKMTVAGGAAQVIAGGLNNPRGIAVDASGNVYFSEFGAKMIREILAAAGNTVIIASNVNNANDVALDAAGNIYFTNGNRITILKTQQQGGATLSIGAGYDYPISLVLDGQNNVYVADNLNHKLKKQAVNYGYAISPALPVGLSITNAAGGISGTPVATSPATNYTVTAVNSSGSGTAVVNIAVNKVANVPPKPIISYASPQTYTVGNPISPLSPTNTGGAVSTTSLASSTYTSTSSFSAFPAFMAIDTSGNIYVSGNSENLVKKLIPGGKLVDLGSDTIRAAGIAVDLSGNVYVVDLGNRVIKKIPAGNGPEVTVATGFTKPYGIALDGKGYMYVSDETTNLVEKIPVGGGAAVAIGAGFNEPAGLAVDASGNVFVADYGNNAVKEILASNGSTITIANSQSQVTVVAVDAAGDVYFPGSGITEIRPDKSIFTYPFNGAGAIALDKMGNIYVVYAGDEGQAVGKIAYGGYSISPSLPAGLVFNASTGVISGTPVSPRAATNYTITGANPYGSSTVTLNITVNAGDLPTLSYPSPNVYNVGVAISPLSPTTSGANTAGNFLTSVVGTNIQASGVALDAAGNIYIANSAFNRITEFPVNGGAPLILGFGFNDPTGVAVDGSGNVFVADYGNNVVKKIPAGNGAVVTVATGFSGPYGIAVDAAGNLYVSDRTNNQVKKIPAGSNTPVIIGTGFYNPTSVAVDKLGNVYVADLDNQDIKKIVAGSGTIVVVTHSPNLIKALALDGVGNIYYLDFTDNVSEYNITTNTVTTGNFNFNNPNGIAFGVADPSVMYVLGNSGTTIYQVNPSGGFSITPALPAGLVFDSSTGVITGTPTTPSFPKNYTASAYSPGGRTTANITISVVDKHHLLTSLGLSAGTLSPAFDSGTTNYTAAVGNGVTSLTVTPATNAPGSAGATIKVNGTLVASATASGPIAMSVGPNTINVVVTASDGTSTTYTVIVTRAPSGNANLSALNPSITPISPTFTAATTSYTLSVAYKVASMTVKPVTTEPNATLKVNGTTLASGTTSAPIALAEGTTTAINVVVTAQDGTTTKTYTLTVTRGPSNNASLASMGPSIAPLTPTFTPATTSYTLSVAYHVTTMTVKPVTSDSNATIKVNGTPLASGTTSAPIPLAEGTTTTINVVVTAQDGTTTRNYTITVTRGPSNNASLASMNPSIVPLTPTFTPATTSYTLNVANSKTSMTVRPITSDVNATITVNGTANPSGTTSAPIALAVGSNNISVVVTAQDGTTIRTYTITVTRASGGADSFSDGISVTKPTETATLVEDGILVHQGISPNGDGINDFLQIENINQYPDNRLTIMNRNGQMIYEAKNYDNSTKVFDGHSNENGQMQLPGTYFYQLEYTVKGVIKHKTGFIVLKY